METLFERIFESLKREARKHDLHESFARNEVNSWDNMTLLENISDALEEMKQENEE